MAGDCQGREPELQVEPVIWKACAGCTVQIPAVTSRVYYFPQGHMEHSSDTQSVLSLIPNLSPTPFHICRVLQVLYLVDPDSDEVFTRIRLEPLADSSRVLDEPPPPPSPAADEVVVSFAKVLTLSDANNGGGFSVPRFCAHSVFPHLNFDADPPVQTLQMRDLRGNSWQFRHIYRGTPRRHLLTTGWSKYVNSKRLISGDSVVFMKNKVTGNLYLGVRRGKKSISSSDLAGWIAMYGLGKKKKKDKIPPETVAEAMELAANGKAFEVVYYPKAGSQNFVVEAWRVEAALEVAWRPGFRVKIALETEDSSRLTYVQGTVSSTSPCVGDTWQTSPWNMLQVAWDEAGGVMKDFEKVNPWQVEGAEGSPLQLPSIEARPTKRQKLAQNGGLSDSMAATVGNGNENGIEGTRQNTNLLETDLNIGGSSQSADSSSNFKSPSPEVLNAPTLKLFGQTFCVAADCTRDPTAEMQELADDQVDSLDIA